MGLRDLRAGTTAVIGDSCPASEIDILTADIMVIKMSQGIIASYPMALAPLLPALNRIFSESTTGKLKVKPFSIHGEQKNPGTESSEMSTAMAAEL